MQYNRTLAIMLLIFAIAIITIIAIYLEIKRDSSDSIANVIFPSFEDALEVQRETDKKKKKQSKKVQNKKKNHFNFYEWLDKKGISSKVKSWYIQAGKPNKDIHNLIKDQVRYIIMGLLLAMVVYLTLNNMIMAVVFGIVPVAFPWIIIIGDIQDRRTSFRREFAYFLQTLSFVLENGGVLNTAFSEVVNKQADGVLKEVMTDVIVTQKANGGDFAAAFATIQDKIKIEETIEFVEIIQNNIDKGIPVAATFASQSATISRFIHNKKMKKIKGVSNTILVPILIIIVAIALLLVSM